LFESFQGFEHFVSFDECSVLNHVQGTA